MPSDRPRSASGRRQSTKSARRKRRAGDVPPRLGWYSELSQRPLQIFLFLLPLVLIYEVGMIMYAPTTTTGMPIEISASRMLRDVYAIFDVSALHLPGVTLLVVLLIWHILRRDPWRAHPGVPTVMLFEAIALAVPLVVVDQIMRRLTAESLPAASVASVLMNEAPLTLAQLDWQTRLVLSVGAGLYEELIFRMVVIAAAHALFVDVMGAPRRVGAALAIVTSAATFTVYHDLTPDGAFDLARTAFLFIAGLYFAFLYVMRGFGIVVGAHAAYDALATVVLPALADMGG